MTVTVTQQIKLVGYTTNPQARVTTYAVEVLRSNAGSAAPSGGQKTVVYVVAG
jgi:hypothetical protein